MKKVEFVIRREDPFENDHGSWDDEDINTLSADMIFEGACTEIKVEPNGQITFIGGQKKVFNYDVLENISGHCYVRESEIKPGTYYEKWREPSEHELSEFIELLRSVHEQQKTDITKDVIYNWYISEKRNNKISKILHEK